MLFIIHVRHQPKSNAFLFFLNGQYLGQSDNHDHTQGPVRATVTVDLSIFTPNQQYLFEMFSISLGLYNSAKAGIFENKGIVGRVWIENQLLTNDTSSPWEHQKGLVGEYFQIYTEQGSSKVDWDTQWPKGINRSIAWFQTRFDLDHIVREDLNANPLLLDA